MNRQGCADARESLFLLCFLRTCNLLLTILANFFFVFQSTYCSCTHPHDLFLPYPRCRSLLHKLFSVDTLSQVSGYVFPPLSLSIITTLRQPCLLPCYVLSILFTTYLHTHDVSDSVCPMRRLDLGLTYMPIRCLVVIDRRLLQIWMDSDGERTDGLRETERINRSLSHHS